MPQQLFVEQREQVIENRVRLRCRSLVDVIQPSYHRASVSEYGRCSVWIMYWPRRLPCTDITRLHSIRLVAGLQRYYAAIRLPDGHLPSSLIRLVGHTRSIMTDVSCFEQEPQGLTGCFDDIMCSASGRATPGLLSQLARTRREILPSSMHTPWAESNRYKISELMSFTAGRPLPVDSPSLPFCVRFNVPLQRRRQHYGFTFLIDTLQHSIRSLWLRATPAGVTPACHQTISSPHVHFLVTSIREWQCVVCCEV
jgi:hypothetical protein